MTEQLEVPAAFGGPPSRRALVHASAWAVPAITVAAAAPAYAAGSNQRVLTFHPGTTHVSPNAAGGWDFFFENASVDTGGVPLNPNRLLMTVTFVPDPGHSADQLSVLGGGPAGWSPRTAGTFSTVFYAYQQPTADGRVPISDGHWFSTALGADQVGSFLLTFQVANFQSATYSLAAPPDQTLFFDPGTSYARSAPGGGWGIEFQGASVEVWGGSFGTGELAMDVTFIPDPGQSDASFVGTGTHPDTWRTGSVSNPTTRLPFTYDGAVSAPPHSRATIPVSDGLYFTTHLPAPQQTGTFQLRFHAPGYTDAVYRMHVPGTPQLHFDPGTTYAKHALNSLGTYDDWGVQFKGASLTVSGGSIAKASDLTMTVTFVPDPGHTQAGLRKTSSGPPHWPTSGAALVTKAVYAYDQTVDASNADVTVPIGDGEYFVAGQSAAIQQGSFKLEFSAPGFPTVSYLVHVPVAQLSFDPGTSFVSGVNGPVGVPSVVNFRGASLTVIGGDVVAPNDLTLTVTFVPDKGYTENRLDPYQQLAPTSWVANTHSFPATQMTYSYAGTVAAAAKDVTLKISDGVYFGTFAAPDVETGTFVLTWSAPGFRSATFQMKAPVPTLSFDPGTSSVSNGRYLFLQGASVSVYGVDLAANDLTMTVSFEPDAGTTADDFVVQPGGPIGWTQQSGSIQKTPTYHYLGAVLGLPAGAKVAISQGNYFYTAGSTSTQHGYIVLTFTASGCPPTTYRIHT